jgi:hypothetical protein
VTVENPHVVDFISTDTGTDDIVLTIADHLPWNEGHEHLLALQQKLNTYLSFIESGELLEARPEAAGRRVRIALMHREPLTAMAARFLDSAKTTIREAGFDLTWQHLPG